MRFLEKLWKIVKNHRDIKVTTVKTRRNYFVSEPNYHTIKKFKLLTTDEKNTNVHE